MDTPLPVWYQKAGRVTNTAPDRRGSTGMKQTLAMKRTVMFVLAWWFLFYWEGYRWQPYGPFIQQDTCERTAANMTRQGLPARCVEFYQ